MLLLELYGAEVPERGAQPLDILDLADQALSLDCYIGEGLERHWVHPLDPERLYEALDLGVVVEIVVPAHRTDDPVFYRYV